MDQLIYASLSHTHYWYEVCMFKVPAVYTPSVAGSTITADFFEFCPDGLAHDLDHTCRDLQRTPPTFCFVSNSWPNQAPPWVFSRSKLGKKKWLPSLRVRLHPHKSELSLKKRRSEPRESTFWATSTLKTTFSFYNKSIGTFTVLCIHYVFVFHTTCYICDSRMSKA